jgi:hypothetical protein
MAGYYWKHMWPGVAVFFAILVGGALSCAQGPEVIGRCSPAGIDEALTEACEKWPETCEVGQRLDVHCVTAAEIESVGRCMRPVDACTMWVGSEVSRARVYVREGVPVDAAIRHESQHWHLWSDYDSNACETHDTSCGWED